jgi:DNA polymerase III alpha subunit
MQSFAGYGFPKAHAAGYAVVAYRCAYVKAHYPAEFMVSRLADWGGYYPQRIYIGEARRMGLTIRPPHVQHSQSEFTLENDANGRPILWMGLDQVREVTRRTITRTLRERNETPFCSLEDWLARVQPRKKEAEHLVRVGALDGLGAGRREMLLHLGWNIHQVGQGQLVLPLFDVGASVVDDFTRREMLRAEEELLGGVVSEPPLARFWPALQTYHPQPTPTLAGHVGQDVVVAGLRVASWRHRTKAGDLMLFLTLEDMEGMIEVVVFPELYARRSKVLQRSGPFVVWGTVQASRYDGDESVVVAARDIRLIAPRMVGRVEDIPPEGEIDTEASER